MVTVELKKQEVINIAEKTRLNRDLLQSALSNAEEYTEKYGFAFKYIARRSERGLFICIYRYDTGFRRFIKINEIEVEEYLWITVNNQQGIIQ